jgi:hypothetical protein
MRSTRSFTVPWTAICWRWYLCARQNGLTSNWRVNSAMKSSDFWDKTSCSPFKVKRRFGETCRLHLQGRWIIQSEKPMWKQVESIATVSAWFHTGFLFGLFVDTKKETCFSETSVDFQQETWACNYLCENLKSYNSIIPAVSSSNKSTNQQTN